MGDVAGGYGSAINYFKGSEFREAGHGDVVAAGEIVEYEGEAGGSAVYQGTGLDGSVTLGTRSYDVLTI